MKLGSSLRRGLSVGYKEVLCQAMRAIMHLGSHIGVWCPVKNGELSVAEGRDGKVKGGQRVKDFSRAR